MFEFSRVRGFFWPVHRSEYKKFLPLFFMALFVGFNYNILRSMKDALLITAEYSGAEVIPFIKVWGLLPGALLITFIYSRLNNKLSRNQVFYALIGIFLLFFLVFTFMIYPFRERLHPHAAADYLQNILPVGFKGLIAMFRYWTFSSFYIMSELWSSAILSMLFWGFANEIILLSEAKRFYALIATGLNLAAIVSGQLSAFLSANSTKFWFFSSTQNQWDQTIILLTCIILLFGMTILGIFWWVNNKILCHSEEFHSAHNTQSQKIRMSMRENFIYLSKSKYLLSIALIVLSYNIVINLVEVLWKDQVSKLYPNPNDYNIYMSHITSITGVISLFLSLAISGQVIRKFGWTFSAILTPVILLITSIGFFGFMLGASQIAIVVLIGSAQNCLSRAAKFTVFDTTKELAFIPLSRECKLKGKAVIDGVASRLGKSGGSVIHQSLLIIFATIGASALYVGVVLVVVISLWITIIWSLGKKFNTLALQTINLAKREPEILSPEKKEEPEVVTAG